MPTTDDPTGPHPGLGAPPRGLPLSRSSVAWQVDAEPAVTYAGGGRALLLQVAHPSVAAGVAEFSSYARDPWGRLFRTLDVMMKLSFGPPAVSARQQRALAAMHRRVKGTTDDGTPYDATDAALQLWVWATLVDTALAVYERVRPALTPPERDRYYDEARLVAHGCGLPPATCPGSWTAFRDYVDDVVARELRVTDAARAVAVATLHPPLPGPLAGPAANLARLTTIGLLPESLRERYGFSWSAADERALDRLLGAHRLAGSLVPGAVRHLGAEWTVRRRRPLRIPWLQRRGAELTTERLAAAGFGS